MGRPLLEITDEICEEAKTLAGQGLTMEQIAAVIGMGVRTIYEKQADYPQFSQAIEAGRAQGIATITNALFDNARSGDTNAQKYYLNNRDNANWKDRSTAQIDHTTGGDKINNFVIQPVTTEK